MRYRKNIFKDKTFLAMAGISILAIGAIAGSVILTQNDTLEEETSYIADLNESTTDSNYNNSDNLEANNGASKANESKENPTTNNVADRQEETTPEETTKDNLSEAGASVSKFSFSADSVLIWPVETTDIVIEYSPDSTVYFATLDKYKTSNAICIRSEIGIPVYASADGIVNDIGYNEEIGNSVSLDLGSDYILQYGQIKDIQVKEGDAVKEGDLLCYVANPTKYYTVEGPNVYLKLTVGDKAVDPLDYLNFE